jgi:hypothetical protein
MTTIDSPAALTGWTVTIIPMTVVITKITNAANPGTTLLSFPIVVPS